MSLIISLISDAATADGVLITQSILVSPFVGLRSFARFLTAAESTHHRKIVLLIFPYSSSSENQKPNTGSQEKSDEKKEAGEEEELRKGRRDKEGAF